MAYCVPYPQLATLNRSLAVQSFIQRVFGVTYSYLSQLKGRTVAQYCKEEETVPKYIANFLRPEQYEILASTTPVEEYDVKLIYKLLKICCGLKPHNDKSWGSKNEEDTLEFLITFCWNEYSYLQEASAMTDDHLNFHMDKVLEALVLLVKKVEEKKKVNETSLKEELLEHIGEKLDPYSNVPCCQHMYTILCEHLVHQMFVMVYIHLNQLNGMSLNDYLNSKKINLVPRTLLSNERKFLEGNPPPQKMSVNILYRVVKRVCFDFKVRKRNHRDALESILQGLKQEYNTPPRNEEEYTDKCYKVYELLKSALTGVCNKTSKTRRLVIGKLAKEPFMVESFQKPVDLLASPIQCASSIPKNSQSSKESPVSLTTPKASNPSQAASLTAPVTGILTVEEVNVCVLHRVLDPGRLAPQTLALVFKALEGNLEDLKKNRKVWKNTFTSEEKQVIEAYNDKSKKVDLSEKDITFLCKLLKYGCPSLSKDDEVWTTISDTLEYHITVIKKERNKLAHEVSFMKTEEAKNTLEIIRNSLDTILKKTESRLEDSEHDMKTDLHKQGHKVKDEMLKNSKTLQTVAFNCPLNMKEVIKKVKETAQQELKHPFSYRESLQCMSPITGSSDSLTVKALFMERELEDKDDIKTEGMYNVEDILFCQNNPLALFRIIVIHSRPGGGKTSICKYAFQLWSDNVVQSSQKGVDLLIYIPCRYVTDKNLSAYLKGKLPQTFVGTESDEIISLLQWLKVLFVIDGYDEAGEEAKELSNEILTSLPNSRIVITTKTQWVPKLVAIMKSATQHYKVLGLMNMTEEKVQQCVKKIFSALQQKTEDYNRFLRYFDEMKEILNSAIHLPLTFSLLALLWIEEHGKPKRIRTFAQLYYRLIDLILQRVTEQLDKNDPFYLREWMITLGEVAWDNLRKNKHHLSEQDQTSLKRKAEELGLGVKGNDLIISSLLHCETHDSLVGTKESWTFSLNIQQEYFAAEYIVDALKKDKTATLSNILGLSKETGEKYKERLQRLIPVVELICELMVIYDGITEVRTRELTEVMSVKEPWSFIALKKMFTYLLEEHSELECVLKTMFMHQEMSIFEDYDPQSTLWVLKNTSVVVPKEIIIINGVGDVPRMKPLLDFLLSELHNVKVIVDVDNVGEISVLVEFAQEYGFKGVRFAFVLWKPLCIPEVVMKWPYSIPLCLSFLPEVFPLVWWECLLCLLTMKKQVTRVVCSQADQKCFKLMKEGATLLSAKIVADDSLAATDVVIHCSPSEDRGIKRKCLD